MFVGWSVASRGDLRESAIRPVGGNISCNLIAGVGDFFGGGFVRLQVTGEGCQRLRPFSVTSLSDFGLACVLELPVVVGRKQNAVAGVVIRDDEILKVFKKVIEVCLDRFGAIRRVGFEGGLQIL